MTNIPPKPSKGYELEVVHPACAKWLETQGYSYQHEVSTPVGRIDFVATKANESLIIECKIGCSKIVSALRQVQDYKLYFGDSYSCVIVVPEWTIDEEAKSACLVRGVKLVGINVPKKEPVIARAYKEDPRTAFRDRILNKSESVVLNILKFHQERNTPPLKDLSLVSMMATQMLKRHNTNASAFDLFDGSQIIEIYDRAINSIDELPYQSLQQYTEQSTKFLESVYAEAKKLGYAQIARFGIIPDQYIDSIYWQATFNAEFYAMADMIDHFNYVGDGIEELTFVDDFGNPITDDHMLWEGSAHSFEDAYKWAKWRKENRPSYFDPFAHLVKGWI